MTSSQAAARRTVNLAAFCDWRWKNGRSFCSPRISCIVTFLAQRHGEAVVSLAKVSLRYRLENAPVAAVRYLLKMIWPADLAVIYPLPDKIPVSASRSRGRGFDFHFPRCLAGTAALAVFARRLAVVFGHARAGHRPGAGRRRGAGRPLHLLSVHRRFPRRRVWLPRFGEHDFNFLTFAVAAAAVLILARLPFRHGTSIAFLARQRNALSPRARRDARTTTSRMLNLGVALEQRGRNWTKRWPNTAAAAKLAPERYQTHNNLGNLLDEMGQPERGAGRISRSRPAESRTSVFARQPRQCARRTRPVRAKP